MEIKSWDIYCKRCCLKLGTAESLLAVGAVIEFRRKSPLCHLGHGLNAKKVEKNKIPQKSVTSRQRIGRDF